MLRLRTVVSLFCAAILLPRPASGFDLSLSDTAVRDAYFLGQRRDEKMAALLNSYVQHLRIPEKGPYVSEIELLTPYAQIVSISRNNSSGYSAQQAALDYRERGDTVVMRVRIELTATYAATESVSNPGSRDKTQGIRYRPNDFWRDFRFGLSQNDRWLEPRSMHGEPVFGGDGEASSSELRGAIVYIEFNANDVASDTAQAEVFTPDSAPNPQHVVATFDLSRLR